MAIDPSGKYNIKLPQTFIGCWKKALEEASKIHDEGEKDVKLAHCYVACRAARYMGVLRFCLVTPLIEDIIGRLIEKYSSNDDPEDANAQTFGIAVAYTKHNCRECCKAVLKYVRGITGDYKPE